MKTFGIRAFISVCILICFQNSGKAWGVSSGWYKTLEGKVPSSDLVIEGRVIAVNGFQPTKGKIYSSLIIRVLKLFKGEVVDSTIELIVNGGLADGIVEQVFGGLTLSQGQEGIFLLGNNTSNVSLAKTLRSYLPLFGEWSYIGYHDKFAMVAHHVATCMNVPYDDLEKDLFQPIEAITGIPRKVFGPNMFELIAAKAANRGK